MRGLQPQTERWTLLLVACLLTSCSKDDLGFDGGESLSEDSATRDAGDAGAEIEDTSAVVPFNDDAAAGEDGQSPDALRSPSAPCFGYSRRLIPGSVQVLGDMTNDGVPDFVVRTTEDAQFLRGPLPGTPLFTLDEDWACCNLRFDVGDVDHDGLSDLIVSAPWDSIVGIFLGPIRSRGLAKITDADIVMVSPAESGLANLFGAGLLAADVNADGLDDLIVGAPAEQEEACFATQDTLVFFGPLQLGTLLPEDADLRIPADTGRCLGESFEKVGDRLYAAGAGFVAVFSLPLKGTDPIEVRRAAFVADIDRDGLLDEMVDGKLRLGNGQETELKFTPSETTHLVIVTQQQEARLFALVLSSVDGQNQTRIHAYLQGEQDIAAWPTLTVSEGFLSELDTVDLDRDGDLDLLASGLPHSAQDSVVLTCEP